MVKLLDFIERLKDWQILVIGLSFVLLGFYLNPVKHAWSTFNSLEEFIQFSKLPVEMQKYLEAKRMIKFFVIGVSGLLSVSAGGGLLGEWTHRQWNK